MVMLLPAAAPLQGMSVVSLWDICHYDKTIQMSAFTLELRLYTPTPSSPNHPSFRIFSPTRSYATTTRCEIRGYRRLSPSRYTRRQMFPGKRPGQTSTPSQPARLYDTCKPPVLSPVTTRRFDSGRSISGGASWNKVLSKGINAG
ncbi:hypothetical protein BJX63DRAFT_52222 [Aspergillus granulosus]|uniref:Secreted protein n=1 Tax=Aspergillus granulosus TaxID=176169 RepID=A0ABR4GZQ4_9EURO